MKNKSEKRPKVIFTIEPKKAEKDQSAIPDIDDILVRAAQVTDAVVPVSSEGLFPELYRETREALQAEYEVQKEVAVKRVTVVKAITNLHRAALRNDVERLNQLILEAETYGETRKVPEA